MHQGRLTKIIRYVICALPLAGVVVADFLPISARAEQFLVLIVLVWFQFFILFEVFLTGR